MIPSRSLEFMDRDGQEPERLAAPDAPEAGEGGAAPDVLVGEIRDPETAAVAIQAAMTGHFVLASVHANTAVSVIARLQDMGVEPFQLAASLRGVIAQRLVRRLCPACAGTTEGGAQLLRPRFRADPAGRACRACGGSGFKGRIPIAEGFLTDETLLRALAERRPLAEIEALAQARGLSSMLADGEAKVAQGLTVRAEVQAAVDG